MSFLKRSNPALSILLCAVIGIMVNVTRGKSSSNAAANPTQDVSSLDRRISLLEQRFYSLESSISRLQQVVVSQRTPIQQPSTNDQELILMREEIRKLSLQLSEVECGLVKLDERTTRKTSAAKPTDPCRLNPDTPVRLSMRP